VRKGSVYRRSGGWAFRVDVASDPESGRRRQLSRQGFRTKAQATAAMREVQDETEPPRIRPADPSSVRQVARSWLERKAPDCAASTLRSYRRCVDKICDRLGDTLVGDLTVAAVDDFERELLEQGSTMGEALSAKSVLGVHAVLYQILDDAVRRGVVGPNVAASAAPPRHNAAVVTTWSTAEVKSFLDAVRHHRLHAVFVVLLTTGLTRGELVGLRWGDIDLSAGAVTVRRVVSMAGGTRTETQPTIAAQRTVTIGPRTIEVLRDHRRASGATDDGSPVFEKRGGGELNPESLSITFARLVDHAGVSRLTISGLRHTHAAMALKGGVNPLLVSKRLGHSTSATTHDMYGHLIPPLHDPNIDLLEATLFEAAP
jgi:integrase